jgi:hypothetical protein
MRKLTLGSHFLATYSFTSANFSFFPFCPSSFASPIEGDRSIANTVKVYPALSGMMTGCRLVQAGEVKVEVECTRSDGFVIVDD